MKNIEEKIKKVIAEIKPSLQAHGGDVQFISYDKKRGIVSVKLLGMCVGCPMAEITLKQGIEEELKRQIPEVKEVVSV